MFHQGSPVGVTLRAHLPTPLRLQGLHVEGVSELSDHGHGLPVSRVNGLAVGDLALFEAAERVAEPDEMLQPPPRRQERSLVRVVLVLIDAAPLVHLPLGHDLKDLTAPLQVGRCEAAVRLAPQRPPVLALRRFDLVHMLPPYDAPLG